MSRTNFSEEIYRFKYELHTKCYIRPLRTKIKFAAKIQYT